MNEHQAWRNLGQAYNIPEKKSTGNYSLDYENSDKPMRSSEWK